jgi:uncharacterized membrane protein
MSFREKSAWIALLVNLGIYGFYFISLALALRRGEADEGHFFGLFVGSFVLLVIVIIVFNIVIAMMSPKDASRRKTSAKSLFLSRERGLPISPFPAAW